MSKYYLIQKTNTLEVQKIKGFVPADVVGEVPKEIPPEDYPYLKHRTLSDSELEIYVDEDLKAELLQEKQEAVDLQAMEALRSERDQLLKASDFSQLPDAPLSEAQVEAWRIYRQALRDLPSNVTDVYSPSWPAKPE